MEYPIVQPETNGKTAAACTILLVDDEAVLLDVGRQMLEFLGHTVIEAKSGETAVAEFERHKARIDLIILDIVMPGMNGTETYEQLKAIDPRVKVLISSGFAMDDMVRNLLEDGTNDFIQKPFSLQELSAKIQKTMK